MRRRPCIVAQRDTGCFYRTSPGSPARGFTTGSHIQPALALPERKKTRQTFPVWNIEPTQDPLNWTTFGRPGWRGAIRLFAGLCTTAFLRSQITLGRWWRPCEPGERGKSETHEAEIGRSVLADCWLMPFLACSLAGCCWVQLALGSNAGCGS